MRKLRLDIQELEVESFSIASPQAGGGTVRGRMRSQPTNLSCVGCAGGDTWTCIGPTYCCPVTWEQTCNASCFVTECGFLCNTVMGGSCVSCATCENMGTCGADVTCLRYDVCGPP